MKQYDSLFVEAGEVLYWQLTDGTSFSVVEDGLVNVKERFKSEVETVIIGITKAASKKNPYFSDFVQDLRLVFRREGDCGTAQRTPSPTVILSNLEVFYVKD